MKTKKVLSLVVFCMAVLVCISAFVACDAGSNTPIDTEPEKLIETEAPVAGETNTPDANETEAPVAGETNAPDTNETEAPVSGETNAPDKNETEEEETVAVEEISLNMSEAELMLGNSLTLVATITPDNATDKTVIWESSDPTVAEVVNGVVATKKTGTVTITAKTSNGKSASCVITVDGNAVIRYELTEDYSFYVVTGIEGRTNVLEIPFLHDGLRVIAIKAGAFAVNTDLEKVILPNSIEYIYENAFIDCSNLSEINLPESLTFIGESAFENCTALKSVTIPGLTHTVSTKAFYKCTALESVEVEAEYEEMERTIGEYAFSECTALKTVVIGDDVDTIGSNAFSKCTALLTVEIGNGVDMIGESSFANCTSLEVLAIGEDATTIDSKAFTHCTALKEATVGKGLVTIGVEAFSYCSSLESFTVGEGLETISTMAFDYCTSLKNFTMPDTVVTLGDMAFRHAEALQSVKFSTSLTSIGNACFQNCVSLDNVELHEGIVNFGESCFSFCSGIKTLRILGDVTMLGDSSFYECTGLEDVYYASSITGDLGINNYVFYNAGTNGEGIVFTLSPDACIPERLFEPQGNKNRPKLVKLIVEEGATKVDYFEKYNTLPYLAEIELPDSITYIKKGCFDNTAWWDAQPDGTVYIENIFYGYKGTLSGEFEISDNTVCVAFGALGGQKPTTLKIPFVGAASSGGENTHFGYIFGAEKSEGQGEVIPAELETVVVKNCACTGDFDECTANVILNHHPNTEWSTDGDNHWYDCTVVGCVVDFDVTPHSWVDWVVTLEAVCNTEGSRYRMCDVCEYKETEVIDINPDAHSWDDENTCIYCHNIKGEEDYDYEGVEFTFDSSSRTYSVTGYTGSGESVMIPSKYNGYPVTSIGEYAFYECTNLTSVTIGNRVTSIEDSAFESCENLTSVEIGNGVTSIGWSAFDCCTSLTNIVIPDSVTSIGDYAFSSCTSLTSVEIPDSVTSMGEGAFLYCTNLTGVKIGNRVTSIEDSAFESCENLTSVEIGNGVTSIGWSAFNGCTSLASIVIPDSVMSIGDYAFSSCTSLTSVEIGDSVESIGEIAFCNCTSLTSVVIGDSVESIGSFAFDWCDSLTSVTFKNPNGWWYSYDSTATSGTSISSSDLANAGTAATYLKTTYNNYYWKCS